MPNFEINESLQVGAYFYPLTTQCSFRNSRALATRAALGLTDQAIPNELIMAGQAQPLFEGHDQPRVYCLDSNEPKTGWDDSHSRPFATQAALAIKHGLSYFIFDSYTGLRNGKPVYELADMQHRITRVMYEAGRLGLKYARMEVPDGPRAVLPIPKGDRSDFMFDEPGRDYDITPAAARFIVDCAAYDWKSPAYLRVGGWRPYASLMMPAFRQEKTDQAKHVKLRDFVEAFREHAINKYQEVPYVIGVTRCPSDIERWLDVDVDAVTEYVNLPISSANAPPIQHYDELMQKHLAEWGVHPRRDRSRPFLPSVPVGWDSSPRGEQGYELDDVVGLHPYVPIVVGSSAAAFGNVLEKAIHFIRATAPEGQRFVNIFAWNEVTEGATLLPRLLPDGTVDTTYLDTISKILKAQNCENYFCRLLAARNNSSSFVSGT